MKRTAIIIATFGTPSQSIEGKRLKTMTEPTAKVKESRICGSFHFEAFLKHGILYEILKKHWTLKKIPV